MSDLHFVYLRWPLRSWTIKIDLSKQCLLFSHHVYHHVTKRITTFRFYYDKINVGTVLLLYQEEWMWWMQQPRANIITSVQFQLQFATESKSVDCDGLCWNSFCCAPVTHTHNVVALHAFKCYQHIVTSNDHNITNMTLW